jgi:rhodanese-related sulfurtransferase
MSAVQTLSREELEKLLAAAPRPLVLDVLPAADFCAGHLPGARSLPVAGLERAAARLLSDTSADIIVYGAGPACESALVAAQKLATMGYTRVRLFAGGKSEWRDAGLPLEADAGVRAPR